VFYKFVIDRDDCRVWRRLVGWWLSSQRNTSRKCLLLATATNMMHRSLCLSALV